MQRNYMIHVCGIIQAIANSGKNRGKSIATLVNYAIHHEGNTWPHRKILINGLSGSEVSGHYPAFILGSDETIHISFTNQIAGTKGQPVIKNITHASFSEKWLIE